MLAREIFYHLSHVPSPFCFSYFSDRVSCFRLGLTLGQDPPHCVSHKSGTIEVSHNSRPDYFKRELMGSFWWTPEASSTIQKALSIG
jgi:hypothetical protein